MENIPEELHITGETFLCRHSVLPFALLRGRNCSLPVGRLAGSQEGKRVWRRRGDANARRAVGPGGGGREGDWRTCQKSEMASHHVKGRAPEEPPITADRRRGPLSWCGGVQTSIWPGLAVYTYSENGRQGKELPLLFHCVCIVVECCTKRSSSTTHHTPLVTTRGGFLLPQ